MKYSICPYLDALIQVILYCLTPSKLPIYLHIPIANPNNNKHAFFPAIVNLSSKLSGCPHGTIHTTTVVTLVIVKRQHQLQVDDLDVSLDSQILLEYSCQGQPHHNYETTIGHW